VGVKVSCSLWPLPGHLIYLQAYLSSPFQFFPEPSIPFRRFPAPSRAFRGLSSSSKTKPVLVQRYIYQPQTQVYMQIHRPSSYTCVAQYSLQTL
jgi:hypothetical protein